MNIQKNWRYQLARSAVLTVTAALADQAFAQASELPAAQGHTAAEGGVTSYPAEFFVDQSPVNAYDMVRLVPGFAYRDSDNDTRGFSGATGNVLIDGRLPLAKTTRLREQLRRIPVSAIERIDVVRGSAPGIDMQGHSIVANIIRRGGVSSINALEGIAKLYPQGEAGGILRGERSRQGEGLLLKGEMELRHERDDESAGEGLLSRADGAGELLRQGGFLADNWTSRLRATGALEKETQKGFFRTNLALQLNRNEELETAHLRDAFGTETEESVDKDRQVERIEVAGNYNRQLASGASLEVLALQTLELERDDSARLRASGHEVAAEDGRAGESIVRGVWTRQVSPALAVEAGGEGAFNFLDAQSELTRNAVIVDVPAANVLVEELRGELFTTLRMRPVEALSLNLGVQAEASEITVSGDVDANNRFSFIKPRFVAAYAAGGGRQLRLGVEREVGQLDFEDFVAGSELTSGTVSAGNPDLAPESAWVLEVAYEQPIFGEGAFTLSYRRSEIQDVVDLIPVSGFAAPGNIGDGTRDEVRLAVTVPLEAIGPGLGRLQFDGTWLESEVVDPVTGERRRISDELPFEGTLLYTREFPAWNGTLGIRADLATRQTAYRIDRIITERNSGYWRAYWDWRPRADVLVRAQVENFTSRDLRRTQIVYDGPRSDGAVEGREERSAVMDPFLMLRVRWTF